MPQQPFSLRCPAARRRLAVRVDVEHGRPEHRRHDEAEPAEQEGRRRSECAARQADAGDDRAARRGQTPCARLRRALLGGGPPRALLHVSGDGDAVAVVHVAHHRLPHLPGHDGARHREGGVRGPSDRQLRVQAVSLVPHLGLLRAVPRKRLQFRQPPARAGGHLLVLRAQRRRAQAGAGRRVERARRGRRATTRCRISRTSRRRRRTPST